MTVILLFLAACTLAFVGVICLHRIAEQLERECRDDLEADRCS
jgi:hypothetical protein